MARATGRGTIGGAQGGSAAASAGGFAGALLAGDPEAAVEYFSNDAQLLTPDGTQVAGRDSILGVLAQLTASAQSLEIKTGRTVSSGKVALATQYWTRSSRSPSGQPFEDRRVAKLVLVLGSAGWQIAIATPWS
jgi:ketosteroid isomerase-like protein